MPKYQIEELIQLRETAHVPTSFDFAEFTRAILEQREKQTQAYVFNGYYGFLNQAVIDFISCHVFFKRLWSFMV